MENLKIVFVIPDMPGGGTERVVALLSNEYAKKGHSVSIMLFAGKETAYALDDKYYLHKLSPNTCSLLLVSTFPSVTS